MFHLDSYNIKKDKVFFTWGGGGGGGGGAAALFVGKK